jgi:hypothetical protein
MMRKPSTRRRLMMSWPKLGVAGDEAAEDDAAVEIHAVEDGLHDFAADVFEVDVDTFGSGGG